jgi:hypothetical protein
MPGARQLEEILVTANLLSRHLSLSIRLEGVEVLRRNVRGEDDPGTSDVFVGGLLERALLRWRRQSSPAELPLDAETVTRGEERGGLLGKPATQIGLS